MKGTDAQRRPGSMSALHSANQTRIVELLQARGELSQAEISRTSGLAPATVSKIVRELASADVVVVRSDPQGRGRHVRIARAQGLVAGVDYGHRHVSVAIADMAHEVLAERRVDLGPGIAAEEALGVARGLLGDALADCGSEHSSIVRIGVGLPAPIDRRTGEVGALSILPGWVGVDAARLATERLGAPAHVDNDANLGVLAEYLWGAGRGADSVAFVKLSEGVGAGLIVGGETFRGRNGTAGEIGHTTMNDFGAVCRCGNRGCLETVVAARSVVELLAPRFGHDLTLAEVVRSARAGDTACARVLADTGWQAGIALANLCNLFNPERILIGGELASAGELVLAPMRESVRRCAIPSTTTDLTIITGELGPRAPVLGAIALALQHCPSPVGLAGEGRQ